MSPWVDRLLRCALALVPVPILWFVAAEPFMTLQRLVPVEATLNKAHTKKLGRSGTRGVYVTWIEPYVDVSYEYAGASLRRFADLQVDDRGLTDTEVEKEVGALQAFAGKAITVWVDPRAPKSSYVHRQMRSARAWAWLAVSLAYWTWIFRFHALFVTDPVEPGTGELARTITEAFSERHDRR